MDLPSLNVDSDDPVVVDLCRRYWQFGDDGKFHFTVREIAADHGTSAARVSAIVGAACVAYVTVAPCVECGAPRPCRNRSEYQRARSNSSWSSWLCDNCSQAAEEEARRAQQDQADVRRRALADEFEVARDPGLEVADLSLANAVYLLSLLRVGGAEDLSFVVPHGHYSEKLSPTFDFDGEILNSLYRSGSVAIHPDSRPEAVVIEDGAFTRFYPFKVHWALPLARKGPSPLKFFEVLDDALTSGDWPVSWHEDVDELHRTVALQECLQYLKAVIEDHGFDFKAGDKTRLVLSLALDTYAVGQVCNFIWRAARDAAAFYVREATTKQHAANIVPGSIQRSVERSRAEGWHVKCFGRDFRAPQSMVSQVLYNTALKIGAAGFTSPPPRRPDAPT